MEMSFAKWPSALKMRLRLASTCPSPFAYASLQPEQGPVATQARARRVAAARSCGSPAAPGKVTAIHLASGERRDEGSPLSRAVI